MTIYGVYESTDFYHPNCHCPESGCYTTTLLYLCKTLELAKKHVDFWATYYGSNIVVNDSAYRGLYNAIAYYDDCPCYKTKDLLPIPEKEYLKLDECVDTHGYRLCYVQELYLEEEESDENSEIFIKEEVQSGTSTT